ncbi:MAG: WecB/TagA/CpsF family glycosyltransferase [Bacteriovorax sp.]
MIRFAGINFLGLKKSDLLNEDIHLKFVTTLNAEIIVKANEDPEFKKIIDQSLCTFDGQIPYLLAKIKYPKHDFQKISGSDFIYQVCEFAQERKQKIYLLGGKSDSNAIAIEKIKEKYSGVHVDGFSPTFSPYPFTSELNLEIREKIQQFSPHYLFVGFGAGKQEMWIHDNIHFLSKVGVRLVVGSGGTFEFVSGVIKRAPYIIQKMGGEGIYRLIAEPKFFRLKRLVTSLRIFLYLGR